MKHIAESLKMDRVEPLVAPHQSSRLRAERQREGERQPPRRFCELVALVAKIPAGQRANVARVERNEVAPAVQGEAATTWQPGARTARVAGVADGAASPAEPFGVNAMPAPPGTSSNKERELRTAVDADLRALAQGEPVPGGEKLQAIIREAGRALGHGKLDAVNRGVNAAIRYESDQAHWGDADRWSSPLETFASGRGDCEDYAIAKQTALRLAGVPVQDLRVVLGRDRVLNQDHAVLAVRMQGQWSILDNRTDTIFKDREYPNFTPQLMIDGAGLKLISVPFTINDRLRQP